MLCFLSTSVLLLHRALIGLGYGSSYCLYRILVLKDFAFTLFLPVSVSTFSYLVESCCYMLLVNSWKLNLLRCVDIRRCMCILLS